MCCTCLSVEDIKYVCDYKYICNVYSVQQLFRGERSNLNYVVQYTEW